MTPRNRNILLIHWIALLLVIVTAAALVLIPGARTLSVEQGSLAISLSADRSMVYGVGDCVTVEWRVEGVREVYFAGEPAIGAGVKQVCLTETETPPLRVVLPDGTSGEYTLPIRFFTEQPAALFLLIVALLVITSALVTLGLARVHVTAPDASGAARPLGRGQRVFTVIGVIAVLLVVVTLALEVILRVALTNWGTVTQRISYVYNREEADAVTGLPLVLPFIGYGATPNEHGRNAFGYRGDEITLPKPEGVYRIIALGSSTTYGFTPDGETYPDWLERILHEDYGLTNVEVINAGVNGYNSWNLLVDFELRILELDPDLIIIYEAGNDVKPRTVDPDCYRGINMLRGLDVGSRAYYIDYNRGTFSPSTLYRLITINLGLDLDPAASDANALPIRIACGSGQTLTPAEAVAQNPPVYWERNLTSVVGVAHAHGVRVLLSTWAYDRSNPEPEPYWHEAVAEHNAITARLAADLSAEYGTLFVDFAAGASQDPSAWGDYVHMTSEGSRLQAATYAAYLVDQGVIPSP